MEVVNEELRGGLISFQLPSETTSVVPSTNLMAV